MKFLVHYGMKIPTNIQYKMADMSITIESDTKVETPQKALDRAMAFVETNIQKEEARYQKLWESAK